jgi:hypothetical protein
MFFKEFSEEYYVGIVDPGKWRDSRPDTAIMSSVISKIAFVLESDGIAFCLLLASRDPGNQFVFTHVLTQSADRFQSGITYDMLAPRPGIARGRSQTFGRARQEQESVPSDVRTRSELTFTNTIHYCTASWDMASAYDCILRDLQE